MNSPFTNFTGQDFETVSETNFVSDNGMILETPFMNEELEEEVIGEDKRTLVANTLQIPNQWVCAIEVLVDNPKWGTHGEQQFIVSGRGTGVLIGPRYVLTARHVLSSRPVKGLIVSPARNESNSTNPFGRVKSKAFHLSTAYRIRPKSLSTALDDYALIILEKDLAGNTHSKMKGALGYWGQDQSIAIVQRQEPDKIRWKEITVIGYPGDTCGKVKFTGSKKDKEKEIVNCRNRQSDKWASTQWRSSGLFRAVAGSSLLLHTADTYEGESGAPICLMSDRKLHLVALHTDQNDLKHNKGVRVTRRMLRELCAWINADAGYIMATIKDDTLVVQPRSSVPASKASIYSAEYEGAAEIFFEPEEMTHVATEEAEDEQLSDTPEYHQPNTSVQEYYSGKHLYKADKENLYEFDTPAFSPVIADALKNKNWVLALELAIKEGWRNKNDLTNLLFFSRHPELPKVSLDQKHPSYKLLSEEWSNIFRKEVWKAIQISAGRADLAVSGEEAAEHHKYFWGKNGTKLKKLIEEVAKGVNIHSGLLATTMIVESGGRTHIFLLNEKVKSYHVGVDDFYEARYGLKARVPAYTKIGWDKGQKPEEHYNDAKTNPRIVKTIQFNTGRDAAFAIAVYLKYLEIRLHEEAVKLKDNFDKLPLETRLALNRMAMASGMGGVLPRLKESLAGKDIFIRKAIPVVIYQTQRNATVRVAQAMHIAEWVFGIFTKPTAQPELEGFEDFE